MLRRRRRRSFSRSQLHVPGPAADADEANHRASFVAGIGKPDDGHSDLAGFITGQGLRSGFACKATRSGRYGFPAATQPAS